MWIACYAMEFSHVVRHMTLCLAVFLLWAQRPFLGGICALGIPWVWSPCYAVSGPGKRPRIHLLKLHFVRRFSGFGIGKIATGTTLVAEPVLCWLRRALLHHYFQDNHINEPNATPPTSLHLVQVGVSELWHRWRTSWRTSSTGCFVATS